MRGGDDGPSLHEAGKRVSDRLLGFAVESRGRFVEQKNGRILQEGSCDRDALTLTAGQLSAPVSDDRVEAGRQVFNEPSASGSERRFPACIVGRFGTAVADVIHQRTVEQRGVLGNDGNGLSKALLRRSRDVVSVDRGPPARQIVEPLQKRNERRLAAS